MSEPFTRKEAMSALWAQIEDFEPAEQVAMLYEAASDMEREYCLKLKGREIDDLVKKLEAKGTTMEYLATFILMFKEGEADALNNGTLWEQVQYLVDAGWTPEVEETQEEFSDRMEKDADEAADREYAFRLNDTMNRDHVLDGGSFRSNVAYIFCHLSRHPDCPLPLRKELRELWENMHKKMPEKEEFERIEKIASDAITEWSHETVTRKEGAVPDGRRINQLEAKRTICCAAVCLLLALQHLHTPQQWEHLKKQKDS